MVRRIVLGIMILTGNLYLTGGIVKGQAPPPPSQNQSGQMNGTPLGGGAAPLAGSTALLLSLGAGYGIRKLVQKKEETEEDT